MHFKQSIEVFLINFKKPIVSLMFFIQTSDGAHQDLRVAKLFLHPGFFRQQSFFVRYKFINVFSILMFPNYT